MPWILFFFLGGAAIAAGTSEPKTSGKVAGKGRIPINVAAKIDFNLVKKLSSAGAPYRFSDGVAIAEKLLEFSEYGVPSDAKTWGEVLSGRRSYMEAVWFRTRMRFRQEMDYWVRNPDRFTEIQRLRGLILTVIVPILASEVRLPAVSSPVFTDKDGNVKTLGTETPRALACSPWSSGPCSGGSKWWLRNNVTEPIYLDVTGHEDKEKGHLRYPMLSGWMRDGGSNRFQQEFIQATAAWVCGFWMNPQTAALPYEPTTRALTVDLNPAFGGKAVSQYGVAAAEEIWPGVNIDTGFPYSLQIQTNPLYPAKRAEGELANPCTIDGKPVAHCRGGEKVLRRVEYGETAESQIEARRAVAVYWKPIRSDEEIKIALSFIASRLSSLMGDWCQNGPELEPSPCGDCGGLFEQLAALSNADTFREMLYETNAERVNVISQLPLCHYIARERVEFRWTDLVILIFGTIGSVLGFIPVKAVQTAAEVIGVITKIGAAVGEAVTTGKNVAGVASAIAQGMLAAFQKAGILQPKDLEFAKKTVDQVTATAKQVEATIKVIVSQIKGGNVQGALASIQGLIQSGKAAWQDMLEIFEKLKAYKAELEKKIKAATGALRAELQKQLLAVESELAKVQAETKRLQAAAGVA